MAYIKAITYYQPKSIVSNDELNFGDATRVAKTMGVETRAWAAEDETSGDLAVLAAKKLFIDNRISPAEIDFVVFCSQGMDYYMPSTSCIIQDRLGIPTTAGAFGMDLGCSGFVYGLAIANSFVDSGLAKNVLLLTAETMSKYMHHEDKNRLLFGDASSATVISSSGFARIGNFDLGTDGSGFKHIIIKNGSSRNSMRTGREWLDATGTVHRDDWFDMDGEAVFNFTVERVPLMINACLKRNGLSKSDVGYFVFHHISVH